MQYCPNCGADIEEGRKFCRMCGLPLQMTPEEATTWRLPPNTAATSEPPNPTEPIRQDTGEAYGNQTGPAYVPPGNYYPVIQPAGGYAPPRTGRHSILLGDWLAEGWGVYRQNWALMSVAALIGGALSICTVGIMAGPLIMGLYRMAFRTMRGERPEMNDLFNWDGRFFQAFLAFLIHAAIVSGLTGVGNREPFFVLVSFIVWPFLTVMTGFVLPLILERKMDIAAAVNEVFRLIFSRDALMWWIVGLVFGTINLIGGIACGIGLFITMPWIVSSAAVAYRDVFGIDDPNRTLH